MKNYKIRNVKTIHVKHVRERGILQLTLERAYSVTYDASLKLCTHIKFNSISLIMLYYDNILIHLF